MIEQISKVEPWNSVRVTLSVPREAAARLSRLAANRDSRLLELGLLTVQVAQDHYALGGSGSNNSGSSAGVVSAAGLGDSNEKTSGSGSCTPAVCGDSSVAGGAAGSSGSPGGRSTSSPVNSSAGPTAGPTGYTGGYGGLAGLAGAPSPLGHNPHLGPPLPAPTHHHISNQQQQQVRNHFEILFHFFI